MSADRKFWRFFWRAVLLFRPRHAVAAVRLVALSSTTSGGSL